MIYRVDLVKTRKVARWSSVVTAMVWALEDEEAVPVCAMW